MLTIVDWPVGLEEKTNKLTCPSMVNKSSLVVFLLVIMIKHLTTYGGDGMHYCC